MSSALDAGQTHAPTTPPPPPTVDPSQVEFDKACDNHRKNLASLDKLIKDGTTETTTKYGQAWPNACDWITAGKTELYALTETHDSAARATALGQAGNNAMFGYGTTSPTFADYNKDVLTDKRNIYEYAKPNWLGFRESSSPSKIAIIEPAAKSKDDVQGIVVHEVQHDADHHQADAWSGYSTEYRAYWLQQAFEGYSAASGTGADGFDSARQQAIFNHLYNDPSYAYVKDSWDNDTDGFKAKVLGLKQPQGTNLVNSPRIDDVYLELTQASPTLAKLLQAAAKLTQADKTAIQASGMRVEWEPLITAEFSGDEQTQVRTALGL